MANQISTKQWVGLGGVITGGTLIFENVLGWAVGKLLDMIDVGKVSWLIEFWPQIIGFLLILGGFAFLKWWPDGKEVRIDSVPKSQFDAVATQHSSFTDSDLICIGFIAGSNLKKFNVRVRCQVSEYSGWRFYDEVEHDGEIEVGEPLQIYPVEIRQSKGLISYQTITDGLRTLCDDGLLYELTVSHTAWDRPLLWKFRVLPASNGRGFVISQSERAEIPLLEGSLDD